MVLGIRTDLKMKKGKKIAQGSHAAVGIYKKIIKRYLRDNQNETYIRHYAYLRSWEVTGVTKIAVKVTSERIMEEIVEKAEKFSIPYYLVVDAGRTQIPSGSKTVIGIFGPGDIVDQITGRLKLE